MSQPDKSLISKRIWHGFAYVAIWQWMAFIILILLVWAIELVDLPKLLFKATPHPPSIARGCFSSALVVLTGIIVVGNTYLQQQRVLKGILSICSYCHKVRIDSEVWQRVESYITERSQISFSHGVCPDCLESAMESSDPPPVSDA